MRRAQGILSRNNTSPKKQKIILDHIKNAIVNELNKGVSWLPGGISPAQLGTIRQQILKKYGMIDNYQKEKKMGTKIGKKMYSQLKEIADIPEKSLLIALIGNTIEFDVGGVYLDEHEIQNSIVNSVNKIINDSKYISRAKDTIKFIEKLNGDLIYLFDNVGEHYFDAIFIEDLKSMGYNITGLVKGKPILNDVTRDDMTDFPIDISIIDTGSADVGTMIGRIPKDTELKLRTSDIIISKGMANFETLSNVVLGPPTIYLFKVKCNPVARVLNLNKGDYVIKFIESGDSFLH